MAAMVILNLTVSHINMVEEWENKYRSDYEKLHILCRLCTMLFVLMLKNKNNRKMKVLPIAAYLTC